MNHPVPVPHEVQQRAFECAYVLLQDYADRLPLASRIMCVLVDRSGPSCVGWEYAAALFQLYRATVVERV